MEPKELLPIVFERSNAANALWNMHIVVIVGLIAFLAAAAERLVAHPIIPYALNLGFILMAGSNLSALVQVTEQRHALIEAISTLKTPDFTNCTIIPPLYVPPVSLVMLFHLTMDVIVVLFISFYRSLSAS